jgi:WD40 repeat protein
MSKMRKVDINDRTIHDALTARANTIRPAPRMAADVRARLADARPQRAPLLLRLAPIAALAALVAVVSAALPRAGEQSAQQNTLTGAPASSAASAQTATPTPAAQGAPNVRLEKTAGKGLLRGMIYSPDGRWIRGDTSTQVYVLDAATGRETRVIETEKTQLSYQQFSPNGRYLAVFVDRQIQVHDLERDQAFVSKQTDNAQAAAVSDSGFAWSDGTRVWYAAHAGGEFQLAGNSGSQQERSVEALRFSADGKQLLIRLSGGALMRAQIDPSGALREIWTRDVGTFSPIDGAQNVPGATYGASFLPDSKRIALASADGAKLLNAETGDVIETWPSSAPLQDVFVSLDNSMLIARHRVSASAVVTEVTGQPIDATTKVPEFATAYDVTSGQRLDRSMLASMLVFQSGQNISPDGKSVLMPRPQGAALIPAPDGGVMSLPTPQGGIAIPTPDGSFQPPALPQGLPAIPTPNGSFQPPTLPQGLPAVPTPDGSFQPPTPPQGLPAVPTPDGSFQPPTPPQGLPAVPTPGGSFAPPMLGQDIAILPSSGLTAQSGSAGVIEPSPIITGFSEDFALLGEAEGGYAGMSANTLALFNTTSGSLRALESPRHRCATDSAINPQGTRVAFALINASCDSSQPGTTATWSIGKPDDEVAIDCPVPALDQLRNTDRPLKRLAFLNETTLICAEPKRVALFDARDGSRVGVHDSEAPLLAVVPLGDGASIALVRDGLPIRVLHASRDLSVKREFTSESSTTDALAVAAIPNSSKLLVVTKDKEIRILDIDTGALERAFAIDIPGLDAGQPAVQARVSPDGKWLLLSQANQAFGFDRAALVALGDSAGKHTVIDHHASVNAPGLSFSAIFSRDGRQVVTSAGGVVKIWSIEE